MLILIYKIKKKKKKTLKRPLKPFKLSSRRKQYKPT